MKTKAPAKNKKTFTEWCKLLGKTKAPQIYSDFEDVDEKRFSFIYSEGEAYLYASGAPEYYSMPMDQVGKEPGLGGLELLAKLAGVLGSDEATAWLDGCLAGARALEWRKA